MDSKREHDPDYSTITTILIFWLTFLLVYMNTRRQKRVPPGPTLFPIIGNLPSLISSDTLGGLNELRKQYGDIIGLYAGSKLFVFLYGYDTIHDALIKKGSQFMERAKPSFDKEEVVHTKGLIFTEGTRWKDGRSFTLAALQDICYRDKGFTEQFVNDEVIALKEIMLKFEHPFDIERYLNSGATNVIVQVVYGHRFDLDDSELYWFQKTIRDFAEVYMKREVILNCLPVLQWFPCDILGIQKTRDTFTKVMVFLTNFIETLKRKSMQGRTSCTYVESYLDRIAANKSNGVESTFDEDDLKIAAYHLIVAGSETTTSTVRWILLHLIRNPHIQEKMFMEMTEILGGEPLSVADRKRPPYVQAVVLEGLRISHVAPLGMPHTVRQDTLFRGFNIPEQCTVIPVLSSALKDPDVWEDPEEFKPERFLNSDGSDIIVPKQFIPFSLGPRSCLGETLARIEIFLFTAGLVQKLRFLPEKDCMLPDKKGVLATTLNAVSFKMRVVER
ncbi:cytochrome P450 2B19-like [Mercenaria mercenaria]|uniref:cytochrome P450 2B19-like n=1 Tax=Mercenaria mercenaria TaxID=6596 RepID=UPI00234E7D85|nr:cytochrome P450 2B19-like [Mercenaria mercenaria]